MAAVLGCGESGSNLESANPFEDYESGLYAGLDNWLCHPDLDDAGNLCRRNLDATIVHVDGSTTDAPHVMAVDPQIDCFYVYPTVSVDVAGNSDLQPGDEEKFVILQQAARFTETCRVFAPIYRQTTLGSLLGLADLEGDRALAYADVLDAFGAYMADHNDGRGVIVIGHSQGSRHLERLVAEVVETNAYLQDHLVAAYLLGWTIAVQEGQDVGGSFQSTPLCRASDQTRCLVTYASFRNDEPPEEETALFGRTDEPGTEAACNNPAALAGGATNLTPYFPKQISGVFSIQLGNTTSPYADPNDDNITTPFFAMPDYVRAECVESNGFRYLEITTLADPDDPRADEFPGDFQPGFGLHLIDVTLAMGDLVELAKAQAQAWTSE